MEHPVRSPILLIVFNRPDTTEKVFDLIRAARPTKLYVAADGARANREGEQERCERARQIATQVDWPCDVRTLFRERNLGCKQAVSQALDWFFDQEEEGIILEDDCVPHPSFFRFCDEMLEHYRDEPRVALISGDNFQFGRTYGETSYYFSRYVHIWGWASWRRMWKLYDRDARVWPEFSRQGRLETVLGGNAREVRYWTGKFEGVRSGQIDTWDYQLNLAMWANDMLAAIPQRNLVTNIGFGPGATHTSGGSKFADLPTASMPFPLRHPEAIAACKPADDYTARTMFLQPLLSRIWGRLRYAI
jgi:hypothetical protein